jgi:hypothetical protein
MGCLLEDHRFFTYEGHIRQVVEVAGEPGIVELKVKLIWQINEIVIQAVIPLTSVAVLQGSITTCDMAMHVMLSGQTEARIWTECNMLPEAAQNV